MTLMQADLEFEYPQKLEKLLVRSDLLRWLDEEEEKLKRSVTETYQIMEQQNNLPGQSDSSSAKQAILTYEDYYGIDDGVAGGALGGRNLSDKGKISFEQFVAQTSSENIFDNDVSLRMLTNHFSFSCLNNSTSFGNQLRIEKLD